jgi:zinc/manganese transport system permease protein
MALATAFGAVSSVFGLLMSYHANLPSGPVIVLAGGGLFAGSLVATSVLRRLAPVLAPDA